MSDSFWDFPQCAKWDELHERQHDRLLWGALADIDTLANTVDNERYTLFGPDEALLFVPKSLIYKLIMVVYCAYCMLNPKSQQ